MMNTQILEIQPRELKFIFELKKQSSCSVRLTNKSNNYVAFKVKTTSPKNYCVRPNIGIIKPKSTCDFLVTMQAPRLAHSDMTCKDKFLVQSAVVPIGTTDEDITSSMFAKGDGKYVEENKLRVILVSPPDSPVLSPINGTVKQAPAEDNFILNDQVLNTVEKLGPSQMFTEDVVESKRKSDAILEPPTKDLESKTVKDIEESKLVKEIEEMKTTIDELESKLKEAEITIFKLTEDRRSSIQERENLQQELAQLRIKRGVKRVRLGFPLMFVCMVALISIVLGYLLHRG